MQINEIISPLRLFVATVRLHLENSTVTVKTSVSAEGPTQAMLLLQAVFGIDSVLSLTMNEGVSKSQRDTQTLDSDQLKLKSLADQKSLISQNEKRERARQKMAKAQQAMLKANKPKPTM
jgi:hypothetical protein